MGGPGYWWKASWRPRMTLTCATDPTTSTSCPACPSQPREDTLGRPDRSAPLTLEMIRAKWAAVRASGEAVGTTLHHACYYVLAYFFGDPWLHDHVLFGCRYPGYLTMRPVMQGGGMGIDK